MSKRRKILLAKYGGSAAAVALIAYFYISVRDFAQAQLVDKYRILCDAFTVPGLLLLMFGSLLWVSNTGALDGLMYSVRMAIRFLIPGGRLKTEEKYGDYVERRREKPIRGYGFLFISGCATMVIALIFFALFYMTY